MRQTSDINSTHPTSILVTGGAGYIGSHTAVSLEQAGFRVVLIDNFCNSDFQAIVRLRSLVHSDLDFHEVDCTDEEGLSRVFQSEIDKGTPIKGVIHFAALKAVGESVEQPERYYSNNIGGTSCLLKVMSKFKVDNLVFSSSCTVYGQPEVIPVDEMSPFLPAESPYGFTKQECEKLIEEQANKNPDFSSALLRYFNPIGAHPSAMIGESPRGVPNNLIPYLCQSVAKLRGELVVFGTDYPTKDGSCVRDYLHVMDLAEAHVAALVRLQKGINGVASSNGSLIRGCRAYNLGTGQGASVLEVIMAFEKSTGRKVPYKLGQRRKGDVVAIWANSSRAKEELDWEAKRTLEEALSDAWRWQEKIGELI